MAVCEVNMSVCMYPWRYLLRNYFTDVATSRGVSIVWSKTFILSNVVLCVLFVQYVQNVWKCVWRYLY